MKTITTINKNFNNSQEIKTSPFATYKDEKVTRYTVDCPRGHFLNDLDKAILLCLNKYLILTSKLLEQALRNIGLENFEQKDLQIQLKFLSQSNFVQKGEFSSPNGKSAAKFYILGNRGRAFLNSIGETVILTNYLASLDTIGIKKVLSANQFAIFTSDFNSDFNKVCNHFEYNDVLYDENVYGKGVKRAIPSEDMLFNHIAKKCVALEKLKPDKS